MSQAHQPMTKPRMEIRTRTSGNNLTGANMDSVNSGNGGQPAINPNNVSRKLLPTTSQSPKNFSDNNSNRMLFKGVSSDDNKHFLPAVQSSTSLRNIGQGTGAIG